MASAVPTHRMFVTAISTFYFSRYTKCSSNLERPGLFFTARIAHQQFQLYSHRIEVLGIHSQGGSNVRMPHFIWASNLLQSGYSQIPTLSCSARAFTSRSCCTSSFPVIARTPSIKFQRMVCNSMATDLELQSKVTTKCFFDVEIGLEPVGRIVIGLSGEVVSKTVEISDPLCAASSVRIMS